MQSQEELFRSLAYFAAGNALPESIGSLSGFRVVRIPADQANTSSKLLSVLIKELGSITKRGLEMRSRQLRLALEEYHTSSLKVIVIIDNAHKLQPNVFRVTRRMVEIESRITPFKSHLVGFIFLGDTDKMKRKIDKYKEISMRMDWF